MKFYGYTGCGTCRKAKQWLDTRNVVYEDIPIRDRPPSLDELRRMLDFVGGDPKKLFNTSGQVYREKNIKAQLPELTEEQVLALLASDGHLIKRPFVLTDRQGAVGFKEEVWAQRFG